MGYFVHSEAGHSHKNEDSVAVRPHPSDGSLLICVLADGQGGQAGGAAASETAVEKCLELAAAYPAKRLLDTSTWYEILSGADEAVCENSDAGFTTLIALCVNNSKICGASCGDSGVLLVGISRFVSLTEKQRKNPPIGSSAASPVAFSSKFGVKDKLIIMSDGVWSFVGNDTIAELAQQKKGQELILALRQLQWAQNGGRLPDDFSIILVQ